MVCQWSRETAAFVKEKGEAIVIVNSDKGNKTVVMRKADYQEKMRVLVGDVNTYSLTTRDPTSRIQIQNNEWARRMLEKGRIDLGQKMRITTYNSVSPRIYGLPKVHKEGVPLRPVVSFIGSPTYKMARFVADQLSPLAQCIYNIKNSEEISRLMNRHRLPENYVLVSLDVVSLFTNVPIELALEEIERRFEELEEHTTLDKSLLIGITRFCLTSGYFTYENNIYLQTEGVAMGSPISPIIADIVMQRALNVILEGCSLRIGLVRKYVDDLLITVHSEDVENVLQVFNAYHDRIQFTLEVEVDGVLPYLDLALHRMPDNTVTSVWYSKPIASQRMLNYNSGHPINTVLNVARNFARRVRDVTTKPGVDPEPVIRSVLRKNDYPQQVIRSVILASRIPGRSREMQVHTGEPPGYHVMMYVRGISERVMSCVRDAGGGRIAVRAVTQNRTFFSKTKDKIPGELKSDVIFRAQGVIRAT